MTKDEIIFKMNQIGQRASKCIQDAPHNPHLQYAEILWMTQEEASEFMQLRLMLPTQGQERQEAKARIAQKIRERKDKKMLDTVN